MAHPEQQEFCQRIAKRFPGYFINAKVLDAGSFDVNGNNRCLFRGRSYEYIGVDVAPGKNVDLVSRIDALTYPDGFFDTIICTEMLEHDMYWKLSIKNMLRMLKSGGLMLITCGTTGRKEHGTAKVRPQESKTTKVGNEKWAKYYQNLTEDDIEGVRGFKDTFEEYEFEINDVTHDLYFCGIKK